VIDCDGDPGGIGDGDRGGIGDVDLECDHTVEPGRDRGEGLGVDVGNGEGRTGLGEEPSRSRRALAYSDTLPQYESASATKGNSARSTGLRPIVLVIDARSIHPPHKERM
jgi:hypothetical protein